MQAMGATGMIFDMRFASAAEQVYARLPQVKRFVAIGDNRPDWAIAYEDLLAGSPDGPDRG